MTAKRKFTIRALFRAAAAACFLYTIFAGIRFYYYERFPTGTVAEWEERGRFLDSVKAIIPRGAKVLAVSDVLPAPDFDYWFGWGGRCELLAIPNLRRYLEADGAKVPIRIEELSDLLQKLGILYTPEAAAAIVARVDYVVVADADDPNLNFPNCEKISGGAGRSFWKVKK
ncbi:MAG: hypothetical protein ACKVS6_12610 [Planctomycetota bacterium]